MDERQPLHQVGREDIVAHRKVDTDIRRGKRSDGCKVGRMLGGSHPLTITAVRSAPHGDLAVAPPLRSYPLHDIRTILALADEGLEHALRIAATPRVDGQKRKTVGCEVNRFVVITLAN